MTEKKLHKADITVGGALLLRVLLQQAGWYKDLKPEVGICSVSVLEALSDLRVPKEGEDLSEEDAGKAYAVEHTEKEREAIKACLNFMYSQGAIHLSVHVRTLFVQFGVV